MAMLFLAYSNKLKGSVEAKNSLGSKWRANA